MQTDTLLSKLESFAKDAKKARRKSIATEANFSLLTDEEIALVLAHRSKKLRIANNLKQREFSQNAHLSSATTYANFEQTGKISLINFIKVIRTLGRMSEFEKLLKPTTTEQIDGVKYAQKRRERIR